MSAATACLPAMAPPSISSSSSPHHRPAELTVERSAWLDDGGVVMSTPRAVARTLACERKQVGQGFAVWRSIGRPDLPDLDPFLSFDDFECTYHSPFTTAHFTATHTNIYIFLSR